LQVLIVRRSYYESTVRFIEAKGQLAQASAKVDGLLLTGGLDAPQDYTDPWGLVWRPIGLPRIAGTTSRWSDVRP
ncbi:hypothetical protein N9N28_17965, partial [Rubripirellula amarantea]|nr:hypothetical protein [Rubripirellula amarantea]